MARHRTATQILEQKGAFAQNPQRRRPNEPETPKLSLKVPEHLGPAEADCWREISGLVAHGVLQQSDSIALEIAAALLAQFRADPENFVASRLTRLQSVLAELGMTPSSRSRVVVEKPNKNEFADL